MSLLRLAIVISFFGFLLLRPYTLNETNLMYVGDDDDYLAHATAIAYGQFPDYSTEGNYYFPPIHSFGPGILASPFVFVGSLIDRLMGHPVVEMRTRANLSTSWTASGFTLASQFYLFLAVFLMYRLCRGHLKIPSARANMSVLLCVVTSGILLYVYRRPVFAHVYEFATVSWGLYFLSCVLRKNNVSLSPRYFFPMTILTAALIYLVRYNNILLSLAFAVSLVLARYSTVQGNGQAEDKRAFVWPAAMAGLVCASIVLIALLTQYVTYYVLVDTAQAAKEKADLFHIASYYLLTFRSVEFYVMRLFHLLFGLGWGLIFTAPMIILGLWGCRYLGETSRYYYLPLLALLVNIYVMISWETHGSWYGHRYFVFAALPFAILGLSLFLERFGQHNTYLVPLLLVWSIIPILSVLAFEGNPTNLTMGRAETPWGLGWANNTYVLEVFKTLVFDPKGFLSAVLKGGPLFVVYAAFDFLGLDSKLPQVVLEKYSSLRGDVYIKTLLFWIFPILLTWVLLRWNESDSPTRQRLDDR